MKTAAPLTGVLLIHGFTGSPHEFAPVARILRAQGIVPHIVTLPAHGDNPTDALQKSSVDAMWEHCLEEAEHFARLVDKLYLVGHSLGGAYALLTAATASLPGLNGVVAYSAPYEHAYWYNYWHGIAQLPIPTFCRALRFVTADQIVARRPRCHPWHVPTLLRQGRRIFDLMKAHTPDVRVPVHLVHSRYDLVVPYGEMAKLADVLGRRTEGEASQGMLSDQGEACPEIRTTTLEHCGHRIFPLSRDRHRALAVLLDTVAPNSRKPIFKEPAER